VCMGDNLKGRSAQERSWEAQIDLKDGCSLTMTEKKKKEREKFVRERGKEFGKNQTEM